MSSAHCDLVLNHWLSGYRELIERISPDDPRAAWDGSHVEAIGPHTMDECPFKDADREEMRSVDAP